MEVCFAALGVFLFAREGEGDDVDGMVPFVWMPGGTGRFIFGAAGAWATAVAGDMLPCGVKPGRRMAVWVDRIPVVRVYHSWQ